MLAKVSWSGYDARANQTRETIQKLLDLEQLILKVAVKEI